MHLVIDGFFVYLIKLLIEMGTTRVTETGIELERGLGIERERESGRTDQPQLSHGCIWLMLDSSEICCKVQFGNLIGGRVSTKIFKFLSYRCN